MKKHHFITLAALLSLPVSAQDAPAAPKAPTPPAPPTAPTAPVAPPAAPQLDPVVRKTQSSYGFGYQTGKRFITELAGLGVTIEDIDQKEFLKALTEALQDKEPSLAPEKLDIAIRQTIEHVRKREKEIAAKNLKIADEFLAANKVKKDVVSLESGLQYKIIEKGSDKSFETLSDAEKANPDFHVSYTISFIDGKEFESSPEGKPVKMKVRGTLPGLSEALTLIPVGAKWKLYLHPDLAFKERRLSKDFSPNSLVVFDIELEKITPGPPPQHPGLTPELLQQLQRQQQQQQGQPKGAK